MLYKTNFLVGHKVGSGMSQATRAFPNHLLHGHLGVGDSAKSSLAEMFMDTTKRWMAQPMTQLLTKAYHRKDWKKISA